MSQQPEKPDCSSSNSAEVRAEGGEFSPEERVLLLKVARDSIHAALEGRDIRTNAPTEHLAEARGAFTTLYVRGALRGCVGYVYPITSLYRTVAETARAAAFEDSRFPPLTKEEEQDLTVHISVLSPLQAVEAGEVEVGRHGLLVSQGSRRGLLLPQVPVEHAWDRYTFLEQACRKAGLPSNAWSQGAVLEAFTAEVFGDAPSA
jgi:AmmeMemoRadiSam system protein A